MARSACRASLTLPMLAVTSMDARRFYPASMQADLNNIQSSRSLRHG